MTGKNKLVGSLNLELNILNKRRIRLATFIKSIRQKARDFSQCVVHISYIKIGKGMINYE